MEQVLNFWIRVINNFLYFQQAMLLPAPSEAKGVCLSVGHKVLFLHLSGSESKISFRLEAGSMAEFFVFLHQYIFVPLSVSTCVMRAPGVMSVTTVTRCHAVSVTGVCPQLVVIAPSHSVSQHRHRSPEPGRENSPRLRHGASEHITHGKMRDGESEPWPRVFPRYSCSAPQCRANMCDYQKISKIIKCFI